MPSHIHLIVRSTGKNVLEDIIRDLQRHTSRTYHKIVEDQTINWERGKRWLLRLMKHSGSYNSNNIDFQFWQQHNHPIELWLIKYFIRN